MFKYLLGVLLVPFKYWGICNAGGFIGIFRVSTGMMKVFTGVVKIWAGILKVFPGRSGSVLTPGAVAWQLVGRPR